MNTESAMTTYREACAAYTRAVVDARRTREQAEERYRSEVAVVREGAQKTVVARENAAAEAEAAKRLVTETDDISADIWRRISSYVGSSKVGMTPAPDGGGDVESAAEVRELLARTRHTIALAQRGELPFEPPKPAVPIAAAIGAVCGLIAVWGASLLLNIGASGDNAQAAVQAGALVVLFIGAFAGLPVVTGWLAVRHRIGARPVHIGACVAGAAITMCAIAPWTLTG